jgi:hypothetical protein
MERKRIILVEKRLNGESVKLYFIQEPENVELHNQQSENETMEQC